MQSVYLRQLADAQAASFVPGLDPDLEPGSPITIHNCPSLSVLDDNFQFQLPLDWDQVGQSQVHSMAPT